MTACRVSVVIPAKNEATTIGALVAEVRASLDDAEIIVVDDGSDDATGAEARGRGARVIRHAVSRGNGAAIKSGARAATGEILVFMDADGQHVPSQIRKLLAGIDAGYDMMVGARDRQAHAGVLRFLANTAYNRLASWMTNQPILDLTSGFRAARAALFRQFLPLLPNGFSYPTTCTMAFLRAGYGVGFERLEVRQRTSNTRSHIRMLRDGGRFFLIIFRVGTLYSPLKIFAPTSLVVFASGMLYYAYTYLSFGRFSNLTALLCLSGVLFFLIGLVSEQITSLLFTQLEQLTPATRREGSAAADDGRHA